MSGPRAGVHGRRAQSWGPQVGRLGTRIYRLAAVVPGSVLKNFFGKMNEHFKDFFYSFIQYDLQRTAHI